MKFSALRISDIALEERDTNSVRIGRLCQISAAPRSRHVWSENTELCDTDL